MNGLADKFNDAKEGKYASAVREPLGKSYQRGYNWPKQACLLYTSDAADDL